MPGDSVVTFEGQGALCREGEHMSEMGREVFNPESSKVKVGVKGT